MKVTSWRRLESRAEMGHNGNHLETAGFVVGQDKTRPAFTAIVAWPVDAKLRATSVANCTFVYVEALPVVPSEKIIDPP